MQHHGEKNSSIVEKTKNGYTLHDNETDVPVFCKTVQERKRSLKERERGAWEKGEKILIK
jgi:hypothetical protein